DAGPALGVLLGDRDTDAVTDVDTEIGVVTGEGTDEADMKWTFGASATGRRRVVIVVAARGENEGGEDEESDDPPASPITGHVCAP
ncbi:MAG TPA: hypothetical protein VF045_02075, partial [Acidimicrobiales bacterium]